MPSRNGTVGDGERNMDMYLGLDCSTQQLKCVVINSTLTLTHSATVSFDEDLGHRYPGLHKGVLSRPAKGEIYAPVALFLDAFDLVLERLKDTGVDLGRIKGVAGAGMQHGTVFWSAKAEELLKGLDSKKGLREQLIDEYDHKSVRADGELARGAFSHPESPNWQDASTERECRLFDALLTDTSTREGRGEGNEGEERLAEVTGSKAHHRFSGPQVMRFRMRHPQAYARTARISLISSFLASLFLGRIAPIDPSDVCGMNLWDIGRGCWHEELLALAASGTSWSTTSQSSTRTTSTDSQSKAAADLKDKLGEVPPDGGTPFGHISPYFVERYGFSRECVVAPFTGDNPATILALPLRPSDAIVSLGTSTTYLMSTGTYKPSPSWHLFSHPATSGLYMWMLCYKNGGLARERVRDAVNELAREQSQESKGATGDNKEPTDKQEGKKGDEWALFDRLVLNTPPLGQRSETDPMKLGLFFPRAEIVPRVPAGEWRFAYDPVTGNITRVAPADAAAPDADRVWGSPEADARAIVESQLLSLRLRSRALFPPSVAAETGIPPQPRRIYIVGGGSANAAIARLVGDVLGGSEGVHRLELGGNACALGAGYKAVWAVERKRLVSPGEENSKEEKSDEGSEKGEAYEKFEDFIAARWDESTFSRKVDQGYRKGVWERYGVAVEGFEKVEKEVLKEVREQEQRQQEEESDKLGEMDEALAEKRVEGARRPAYERIVSAAQGSTLIRERDHGLGQG